MPHNAPMHTTQTKRPLPRLQKDRPKKVLDAFFDDYQKRHRVKLSENQLAALMTKAGFDIHQTTINRIRKGKLYPDVETAAKLASYLGVGFAEFVGLAFWAPPNPDSFSAGAKRIGKAFDTLDEDDQTVVNRIIEALEKT